jgi:hypothetical protein
VCHEDFGSRERQLTTAVRRGRALAAGARTGRLQRLDALLDLAVARLIHAAELAVAVARRPRGRQTVEPLLASSLPRDAVVVLALAARGGAAAGIAVVHNQTRAACGRDVSLNDGGIGPRDVPARAQSPRIETGWRAGCTTGSARTAVAHRGSSAAGRRTCVGSATSGGLSARRGCASAASDRTAASATPAPRGLRGPAGVSSSTASLGTTTLGAPSGSFRPAR